MSTRWIEWLFFIGNFIAGYLLGGWKGVLILWLGVISEVIYMGVYAGIKTNWGESK